MGVGLYIHVPFCLTRCHFCAFYFQIYRQDAAQAFLAALRREIQLHAERKTLSGRSLDTVYFGGGTPTTLDSRALSEILGLVRDQYGLKDDAEVTLEAHPETVTADGLAHLAEAGVNRVSMGVQSADPGELAQVGRATSWGSVSTAVSWARSAHIENINLDLIYGLPGQSLKSWQLTLDEALVLTPTHISCYALTVEDDTTLKAKVLRGQVLGPDTKIQNSMEDLAADQLSQAGYDHYEISNYCRPDYACRHNLLYWQGGEYLGLGPSAQSYVQGCRFGTVDDLRIYARELQQGRLPVRDLEQLTPAQQWREAIVFGLRLMSGVNLDVGSSPRPHDAGDSTWEARLSHLTHHGLVERQKNQLKLTSRGRRVADSVAVELF
ncbi:MAG: radical SAM family heme chaperone HemW [Nitrospiraceae bacterium]